jgi:hypothetical protein
MRLAKIEENCKHCVLVLRAGCVCAPYARTTVVRFKRYISQLQAARPTVPAAKNHPGTVAFLSTPCGFPRVGCSFALPTHELPWSGSNGESLNCRLHVPQYPRQKITQERLLSYQHRAAFLESGARLRSLRTNYRGQVQTVNLSTAGCTSRSTRGKNTRY